MSKTITYCKCKVEEKYQDDICYFECGHYELHKKSNGCRLPCHICRSKSNTGPSCKEISNVNDWLEL